MLDSYADELQKKRSAKRLFWLIVLLFSILLYMFFQGYYFSVRVGFEKLLHPSTTQYIAPVWTNDGVLKSFGIINLKVDPNPASLTINTLPYQNGDKRIYDYGKYIIQISDENYLPVNIDVELSRSNPFYLNSIKLLGRPNPVALKEKITALEPFPEYTLAETLSGVTLYQANSFTGISLSGTVSPTMKYISEWIFSLGWKLSELTFGDTLSLVPLSIADGLTLCSDARVIRSDIYCEKNGKFLTGKYKDLREKVIEAHSDFIRTPSNIIRLWGGFFNSSTPIPETVSLSGASRLWQYGSHLLLGNKGRMYDLEKNFSEVRFSELDQIFALQKFGDEIVALGTRGDESFLRFEDGKNSIRTVSLGRTNLEWISLSLRGGAYFIVTDQAVFVYYKGANEVIPYVYGEILGIFNNKIYYSLEKTTYAIQLEEAN